MQNGKAHHPVNSQSCTVEVLPRLHITLIGMGDNGYRRNGGIGFSIDNPRLEISVYRHHCFSLHDTRQRALHVNEQIRLKNIIESFSKEPVRVEISGEAPSHYGFGSATAIRLATLEAIAELTAENINRETLVKASGRGGTSGIGVTTYFEGGLICDVGVKDSTTKSLPSSVLEHTRPAPLVLKRFDMPNWKVGLCIPSGIEPQTEEQEVAFFKRMCPISSSAVNEILYHSIYGICASVMETDFGVFCNSINAIQNCAWKQSERDIYGEPIRLIESAIYKAGASAVGMSSLGPGLFFLSERVESVTERLMSIYPQHIWKMADCHNSGRKLILR